VARALSFGSVFFREKENEHDFKSEQGEKNHF